jgi:hypothetical protein
MFHCDTCDAEIPQGRGERFGHTWHFRDPETRELRKGVLVGYHCPQCEASGAFHWGKLRAISFPAIEGSVPECEVYE